VTASVAAVLSSIGEWEKGKRRKNPWLDGGFCGVSFEADSPDCTQSFRLEMNVVASNGTCEEQGGTTG